MSTTTVPLSSGNMYYGDGTITIDYGDGTGGNIGGGWYQPIPTYVYGNTWPATLSKICKYCEQLTSEYHSLAQNDVVCYDCLTKMLDMFAPAVNLNRRLNQAIKKVLDG